MKLIQSQLLFAYSAIFAISLLLSCKREEPKGRLVVNSFSMRVNNQVWTPFQAKDDPCTSTYNCQYAVLGDIPLYTIYAYRDPNGTADASSENLLRLRVMNVTEPGTYLLDGSYTDDFDSYLIFQVRQAGNSIKRYVNDPRRSPFEVNVNEIFVRAGSTIPSIQGSFSGILYNETDPSDSLTIGKGEFNFKYVGVNYDGQCE